MGGGRLFAWEVEIHASKGVERAFKNQAMEWLKWNKP
jgi:hypothetical protein